ncbi:hypothetical protein PR202_gb19479 [Eleusine coracana subsp. coracana]|uniref:DUF6598 domain-containing protein n=1 Tax=Eleusine coracana subsp. coracana TaxID=191504 RepID=A0AAV5F9R6_ELECO|nr:hypothetical protein PR202_gb19479 [Eleusine coracana subsp. coracana]
MRHSTRKYQAEDQIELFMFCSANILSIKIASSDVGYPINVYGTVIARDSLDHKCIYLFRCDRRHSQLIKSEDKSLILIGPSRGLLLQDFIFLEVDLKIKGERGQDKLLFRRLLEIDGRVVTRQNIEVRSVSRPSRLSIVEVEYAVVKKAMEATIEFQILKGDFFGKITAHTTSIPNKMLLYNSKRGGVVTSEDNGTIQLWRRVIAVSLNEMLIFNIEVSNGPAAASTREISFTPQLNDADEEEFFCGGVEFQVKVTWSVIDCYD